MRAGPARHRRAPRPMRHRGRPAAMERKRGSAPMRGHLDGSINLRALQLATHVERHGSIRLAARTPRLLHSVVSRRIRGLEDELGAPLFERRPSGIRTAAAGARFLQAALRMFAELDGATGAAPAAGSGPVGQLVIGTYFSASVWAIPRLPAAVHRATSPVRPVWDRGRSRAASRRPASRPDRCCDSSLAA